MSKYCTLPEVVVAKNGSRGGASSGQHFLLQISYGLRGEGKKGRGGEGRGGEGRGGEGRGEREWRQGMEAGKGKGGMGWGGVRNKERERESREVKYMYTPCVKCL